ncbi:SH3 domain-containing protein [Roseivivax sp. CAU 1761]
MIRALALLCCAAGPALGQDLPALYDVARVPPGDVLNVRAAPDPAAARLGALARDATAIEVTAATAPDGWGRINHEGRAGWVSLDFLDRRAGLPEAAAFRCFGTEPFWAFEAVPGGISTFRTPEEAAPFVTGPLRAAEGMIGRHGLSGGGRGRAAALWIEGAECSDGMSDQLFGLTAALILSGQEPRVLAGCCSLAD